MSLKWFIFTIFIEMMIIFESLNIYITLTETTYLIKDISLKYSVLSKNKWVLNKYFLYPMRSL